MKFRDLKKLLAKQGIQWDESGGKGSHGIFRGEKTKSKVRATYPIPKHQQREIRPAYLNPLRL